MFSWFPLFIPVKQPIYVQAGQVVEACFWRKVSSTKVRRSTASGFVGLWLGIALLPALCPAASLPTASSFWLPVVSLMFAARYLAA